VKYKYKIIYHDHQGQPGVIGVNAKTILEAAEMAEAIAEGLSDVAEIKGIELRDACLKKGANHE